MKEAGRRQAPSLFCITEVSPRTLASASHPRECDQLARGWCHWMARALPSQLSPLCQLQPSVYFPQSGPCTVITKSTGKNIEEKTEEKQSVGAAGASKEGTLRVIKKLCAQLLSTSGYLDPQELEKMGNKLAFILRDIPCSVSCIKISLWVCGNSANSIYLSVPPVADSIEWPWSS